MDYLTQPIRAGRVSPGRKCGDRDLEGEEEMTDFIQQNSYKGSSAATPLDNFNAELARTGVISEDFKGVLRAWAYEIARDAYERGKRDAGS